MRIIKAGVEQITPKIDGPEFLKAIEVAGRTCYKSEDKITDDSAPRFVKMLLDRGHEAMLEHAPSVSMRFICDRGVSHEIVRHRLFSFAQESTRYCNYGKDEHVTFIWPCWFEEGPHFIPGTYDLQDICRHSLQIDRVYPQNLWFWSCRDSELAYFHLLEAGWSPQQARSVLPNSLKTEIVVTGNLREWRHFFKLRLAPTAHPQMREVAIKAFYILQLQIPVIFDDMEIAP